MKPFVLCFAIIFFFKKTMGERETHPGCFIKRSVGLKNLCFESVISRLWTFCETRLNHSISLKGEMRGDNVFTFYTNFLE